MNQPVNPYAEFAQDTNPYAEFVKPEMPTTPVAVDVAGQLATGIVKGIPNLLDVGGAAVATLGDAALGRTGKQSMGANFQQYMQNAPVSRGLDTALGTQERQAETTLGKYANLAGQGISTAPLLGAKMLQGAAGGFGAGVGGDVGRAVGGPVGEVVGSLAGGMAGAAGVGPLTQRAKALTQRAVAPTITPERAALAQRAQEFGVPLSVTQIDPTRFKGTVQKVSQELPFSGVGKFEDAAVAGWNKAFTREALGMEQDTLNPDTVRKFLDKVDQDYTDVFKGTTVRVKSSELSALDELAATAKRNLSPNDAEPVLNNIKYVRDTLKGGFVTGEKANSLRKELMRGASSGNLGSREYLGELAATVGDTLASSLPAEKAQKLLQTNRYYRNFKTAEPLLEKAKEGVINPVDLQNRVAASKFIKSGRIDTGDDVLVDLARIGQLMPKLSGSDTAQKTLLQQYGGALAAGGAAAIDIPATGAGLLANRAYQSLYNQNPNIVNASIKKSGAAAEAAARKAAFEARKKARIKIDVKPSNLDEKTGKGK